LHVTPDGKGWAQKRGVAPHSATSRAPEKGVVVNTPGYAYPQDATRIFSQYFTSSDQLVHMIIHTVDWGLPPAAAGNPWPTCPWSPAPAAVPLTARDVLRAKALRLDTKVGSLTPSKEADIIILDAPRICRARSSR
jgi:hypothetical protein